MSRNCSIENDRQALPVVEGNGQLGFQLKYLQFLDEHSQDHNHEMGSSPGSRSSTNMKIDLNLSRASDIFMAVSINTCENRTKITEIANSAMDELIKLATAGEPLWNRQIDQTEILNGFEYTRRFSSVDATLNEIMKMVEVGDLQNFDCNFDYSPFGPVKDNHYIPKLSTDIGIEQLSDEASREMAFVNMLPINLVELLMDVNRWSAAFSSMVSRATLIGVLSTGGPGEYDGKLQVITAEFHLPTALVPVRESCFARYCKQVGQGVWGIVDVSLESLFPSPITRFKRRPSGCLIRQMPNGFSEVQWVEHVEVDHESIQNIFKTLILSGFPFSAKCWMASLIRYCEEIGAIMDTTSPVTSDVVLIQNVARKSLLRLSNRMMRAYCQQMNASSLNSWMSLPIRGGENMKFIVQQTKLLPTEPSVKTVAFTTSIWLPVLPNILFDFFQDVDKRNQWDMLAGTHTREVMFIANGKNGQNRITVLQTNNNVQSEASILYLQKCCTDESGSYVVFAPIDLFSMYKLLNGSNPDHVLILASGFSILPDNKPLKDRGNNCGSLLTIGFHIVDSLGRSSTDLGLENDLIEYLYKILATTISWICCAVVPAQ